jgi:hypothetical protein
MTIRYTNLIFAFVLLLGTAQAQWTQWGQTVQGDWAHETSGGVVSMPDAHTVGIGPGDDGGATSFPDRIRVFTNNGNGWEQKGDDILGPPEFFDFGKTMCMGDANTIAAHTGSDGGITDPGHVLVHAWSGSTWEQKGMPIDGDDFWDSFGRSLCMPDGNTLAIGVPGGAPSSSGHVEVYAWDGSDWVQKGANINGAITAENFGRTVCMPDPNTVAIAAQEAWADSAKPAPVRIYDWDGALWVQRGADIMGGMDENFGRSLSMPDANTIAMGAPGFKPYLSGLPGQTDPIPNDGLARVYTWNGSAWVQKGADINDDPVNDNAGWSVSMPDANTVAVGAPNDTPDGAQRGFVRVYGWDGGAWVQTGEDIPENNAFGNQLGKSISMPDTQTVAVGAPIANTPGGSHSGMVMVYTWGPTSIAAASAHPFRIFPGASPDRYVVDLGSMRHGVQVTLLDPLGRTVGGKQLAHAERFDLQLPDAAGLYVVNVHTVNGPSATLKVVNAGR